MESENGQIVLIASTTENPYLYVYNAIISRSMVFEFKAVPPKEMVPTLVRGLQLLNAESDEQSASDQVLYRVAAMRGRGCAAQSEHSGKRFLYG